MAVRFIAGVAFLMIVLGGTFGTPAHFLSLLDSANFLAHIHPSYPDRMSVTDGIAVLSHNRHTIPLVCHH